MPHFSRTLDRALATALAVAAIAYLLACFTFYAVLPADDAFLPLRVARHLVERGEPYYNAGEAICATSSPLWVLLLAAGFVVAGPSTGVALVLGGAALVGAYLALLALLARDLPASVSALAAFVIVALATLAPAALLLEPALALLLWCRSAAHLRDARGARCGVWAALAVTARYEFVLWLAVALLALRGARARRWFAFGAAAPLATLAAWSLFWYGDLVPATVRAKAIVYELSLGESIASLRLGAGSLAFVVVLLTGALLIARLARERRDLAAALAFGALLPLAYVARETLVFAWYRPLFLLPLLTGGVLALASSRNTVPTRVLALGLLVACGARPTFDAVRDARGLFEERGELAHEHVSGLRVQRYLRLGAELYARDPNASLLAPEIGGLGWTFRGRVLDGIGLATPEVLRHHPMPVPAQRPHGALGSLPPRAIEELAPDFVVMLDVLGLAARQALESGAVPGYRLLERVPALCFPDGTSVPESTRLWGAQETLVYVRESLSAAPSER